MRAVAPEEHAEVRAVDVLHREEQRAIGRLAGLVELEDVRMVERLRVLHLALEAGRRSVGSSRTSRLDSTFTAHRPPCGRAGEVDGAHAALAEHRLEPVAGDLGAQLRSASHSRARP